MKVIIDSGHGGNESGAVYFGLKEKDLNLEFAKHLVSNLKQLDIPVDDSLVNDNYYSPEEISALITGSGAAICISCHNNAFNGKVRGFEVIYSIHTDGTLAKLILEKARHTNFPVRRAFSRENTTSKGTDYYYLIRLTYPEVETVIVEYGFMDNSDDLKMLIDPVWQDKLTKAVAKGIKEYIPVSVTPKTQIMGRAILKAEQLKAALFKNNPETDQCIVDIYYNTAEEYGIKADLAFLQAINESNWFKFTGIIKLEQNNFGGLGAVGNGISGDWFDTVEEGVEAHIQHLFAYACKLPLPEGKTLVDPRFELVTRGSAPYFEDLDGKWAVPGTGYGKRIADMQRYVFENFPYQKLAGDEETPSGTEPPEIPVHWAKSSNDELMETGILNNDHSKTLDKPASEGMVICIANRLRNLFIKNSGS